MKRGFLAKAYNANKSEVKSTTTAPEATGSKEAPLFLQPLSYGVVNEKLPADHVPNKMTFQEADPAQISGGKNSILMTTQPPVPLGSTFAEYPDRWTECLVTPAVKQQIVSAEGFPKAIPRPRLVDGKKPYEIKEIAGRGLAVVATRDLKLGDLVISERPMAIIPRVIRPQGKPRLDFSIEQMKQAMMVDWEGVLKTLIDRMRPEHQKAFMALHNSHQHDGSGPILGILRTNGFCIDGLLDKEYGEDGGLYTGTFEDASRLNHSCCPNTYHTWDAASFSIQFHVLRDVMAGEELTTYYIDLEDSTADRQRSLLSYGFQCTCSSCASPDISENDRKRKLGLKSEFIDNNEFAAWFRDTTQPDDKYITRGLAELKLLRELEMDIWMSGSLYRMTQSCVSMGDAEGAMKYGKLLRALNKAKYGTSAKDPNYTVEYFKALPTWGVRAQFKKKGTKNLPATVSVPWEMNGGVGVLILGGGDASDPMDALRGMFQMQISQGNSRAKEMLEKLESVKGMGTQAMVEMLQGMMKANK